MPWQDHLGKTGGGLMAAAFASAVGYLIASNTGTPTPSTKKPPTPVPGPALWPYVLCGAMFVVGALVYGAAHGMLPWQTRRALKRRAEAAESALKDTRADLEGARTDLDNVRADLAKAQRERDEARGELGNAQRTSISAPATSAPPPFELRHYTRKASLAGGWVTSHFVGVTNPAGQPERRAYMSAEVINPYPRNRSVFGVEPALPHAVSPESGGTATAGLVIRPGQEQSWFIGNTLTGGDGKINVYGFFSDTNASWELGPDERWRLSYRIACDGVPDVPFSIVIAAEEGKVALRLEG